MKIVHNVLRFGGAAVALALVIGAPQTLADEVTDIGFVDQQALAAVPAFQNAQKQLAQFDHDLQTQLAGRAKNAHSASDQQKLQAEYQSKMRDKQSQLFGPLFGKAQTAIASIASSKNLSVVVDRRIVIVGGQDITRNVLDLLTGVGDPVPPVSTPPPSAVGYVDQGTINQLPSVQNAEKQFDQYRQDQAKAAQDKLKSAKTDADKQTIARDYQKNLDAKQNDLVKPLVEKTRDVIGDVAKKKNLVLVIDRSNLVYGGTDITSDVTAQLK
jgi:outer membrane protein